MDEIDQFAERLHQVEYFKHLSAKELIDIVSSGSVKRAIAGEYLFHENDACGGMYVLVQGQVNLLKNGPDGQETILNTINPVTMFNEVPVLDGGPNPASAVTTRDALLWRITCDKFRTLLARYPQVSIGLLSVLARRNRMMINHYGDLSFRSVPARVAKHLVELSNDGSEIIQRSQHPIKVIAARVVAAPEAVSRTLKVFKMDKLILCDRKSIQVIDLKKLQLMARIEN